MTDVECRYSVITTFAGWTALSALRSGSPVKSRADIYPLLERADFAPLLTPASGPVSAEEFADWHRGATDRIQTAAPKLVVGWATKMLNVYLKTAAYVGDLGRPGLRDVLHPPIDGGLWNGLESWLNARIEPPNAALLARTHAVRRIKLITDYPTYEAIIAGCREVAAAVPCRLVELEQFWEGAAAPRARRPLRSRP
ncbi:MAG: hypothetical protein U0804_21640 [Gemmataceae bacterium]